MPKHQTEVQFVIRSLKILDQYLFIRVHISNDKKPLINFLSE